ncbi:MAG TPA: PKD domain-containing protein, partial [Thermoanaerobaculia bacterium]|nr:PKD domain-containing protein [Thermoanaerobaculia bacterium]
IAHDPLKCLSTEARPLVDARVLPAKEMDQGFVYFRAIGTEDFYYVLMKPRAQEDFMGELPRPMPGIRGIDYFVQALDRESLPKKTPEYAPPVTDRTVCRDERTVTAVVTVTAPREGLTIGLTKSGQNPVPSGFNKDDIAKVILVTGAVVSLASALSSGTGAAAGATAAASGGLSTGAIIGISAGVAALGVGVAVAANNNKNDKANTAPTIGTATVTPLYGSVPLQVTATATASDPDGDAVTLTWNFGPGSATGNPATYTYQVAGTWGVGLSASDGRGGTAATAAVATVKVDPQGTPQYLTGLASWSGDADLDVRIAGPGGIDVATQPGGRKLPAGCTVGNRTETVINEGNRLPPGSYTLFVKHAATCSGSPATARFSYSVQATSGSKCAGLLDVAPGAEIQACAFTFP